MVENTPNAPKVSRLALLLENIDTSSDVKRRLEAAQKKLAEVEQSIVVLTQQLAEKADSDVKLQSEVFAFVEEQKKLGVGDELLALIVSKHFNLSLPTPNRPSFGDSSEPNKVTPSKTPEQLAKKMGINEKACDEIAAFVASNPDGVGMKQIVEQFPEHVQGDSAKFAGYVRSLAESGRIVKTGCRKGTKYFARAS